MGPVKCGTGRPVEKLALAGGGRGGAAQSLVNCCYSGRWTLEIKLTRRAGRTRAKTFGANTRRRGSHGTSARPTSEDDRKRRDEVKER